MTIPPIEKPRKATMTFNLDVKDMELLERIAERKSMTKTAVLRQALRLYQSVRERLDRGEKVFVDNVILVD